MNRRTFLSSTAAGALTAAGCVLLPSTLYAQTAEAPAEPVVPTAQPFSFDILTDTMRDRATQPYAAPQVSLPPALSDISYDQHRASEFRRDRGLWRGESPFEIHPFHPGWLFKDPVEIFVVGDGQAVEHHFQGADFQYHQPNDPARFEGLELPGVAGFKVLYPLNKPRVMDELVSFLGASYFRALGRGNVYGLSARGLAINTATQVGEEFPRFSAFYIEKPVAGAEVVRIWATMDSPSVTGAYQFVINPGRATRMDVTARLFLRQDIQRLGIAPLTSMFLFGENNRSAFRDYRSAVHDSDGLKIVRANGEQVWRSLNNPARLAMSFIGEENPRAFGLFQRDREFENYQDAEAWYERRPSALVEPLDQWGKGTVALVEIPTDLEVNDNIVAFWIPEGEMRAGQSLEFRYRLSWGELDEGESNLARVVSLRGGHGGVSGVSNDPSQQKFVIDFKGSALDGIPPDSKELESIVRVEQAELVRSALSYVPANNVWRLVIDIAPTGNRPVELNAFLSQEGTRVSEIWFYQWRAEDERAG